MINSPEKPASEQKQYWRFYWPLLLWSLSMVVARQLQNGVLASYGKLGREIAVNAYAASIYFLPLAMLAFVPQLSNALGRSKRSRRVCLIFVTVTGCLGSLPLFLLGMTEAGPALITGVLGINDPGIIADVSQYLRLLAIMPLLQAVRQFYSGLLVQARRTGIVAAMNIMHIPLVGLMLGLGLWLKWTPVINIALAQLIPISIQLIAAFLLFRFKYRQPLETEKETLTYTRALKFFWPVAFTGLMFALTRPLIFSFVNRIPGDPTPVIAALRVAFDLAMLFQMASNQFRHVFVTFGEKHLPGLRRFMLRVVITVTATMLMVALTPLGSLFFDSLLGLEEPVASYAAQILLVMCLIPGIIAWRNYYHGLALIHHRTVGMSVGGIARNSIAYLACWLLLRTGTLNHYSAASVLCFSFIAEAIAVIIWTRSWRINRPQK
jgi:progressive ankylosis protein